MCLRTANKAGDTTTASVSAARAARTFANGLGVRRDRSAEVGATALGMVGAATLRVVGAAALVAALP